MGEISNTVRKASGRGANLGEIQSSRAKQGRRFSSRLKMKLHVGTADPLSEPIARGNLRAQVTARLVTGIFAGRLRSGERLVVQQLATVYEVSPTPVREALVELASLGLVDLLPNRGAIVRPFGPAEVREISQIRRLLETEATHHACGRIPPAELSALNDELLRLEGAPRDQTWDRDARAADTRLHGLIAESSGNLRLGVEIGRYLILFRALRDVCHLRDAGTNYSRATTCQSTWRSFVPCFSQTPKRRRGRWTRTFDPQR